MKKDIHPKYYQTTATCACGASYEIGSTRENFRVDICAGCHPLFTGKAKLLDAEGRISKFQKRYANVEVKAKKAKPKKKARKPSSTLKSLKSTTAKKK